MAHKCLYTRYKQFLKWLINGFYGHPETAKRSNSWSLLKSLKLSKDTPWFCFGDFNEILSQREKVGANWRSQRQIIAFQEALHYCFLSEIPSLGQKFTWSNHRVGGDFTKEKIDRTVTNYKEMEIFLGSHYKVLPAVKSDRSLLVISFSPSIEHHCTRKYTFIYEGGWVLYDDYS